MYFVLYSRTSVTAVTASLLLHPILGVRIEMQIFTANKTKQKSSNPEHVEKSITTKEIRFEDRNNAINHGFYDSDRKFIGRMDFYFAFR